MVELFDRESLGLIDDIELENLFLKSALNRQKVDRRYEAIQLQTQIDKLKFRLFYEHQDELKAIMALYNEKKEAKEKREKEIDEECRGLKQKLKSGEIDDRQYKKKRNPLKREKDYNIFALRQYSSSVLEPLFPDLGFNIADVEKFFEDPRSAGPSES